VNDIDVISMLGALALLVICSAFFSASETGMMRLNRYRLSHMAQTNRHAKRVAKLLERTDKLLSAILIGNTFANILASSVATVLMVHFFGDLGVVYASFGVTVVLLVFGEVMPKTIAAQHPEKVAFFASFILKLLLWLFYPVVVIINGLVNGLLFLFGQKTHIKPQDSLSREELRTVLNEAGQIIPKRHRHMLTNILDLEYMTVNDIMVPRAEIIGIDFSEDWDKVLSQISNSQHSFLPVYENDFDNLKGILHVRNAIRLLTSGKLNAETLPSILDEPYFVPEETPLHKQMLYFQKNRTRRALVVNEYGDIQGIVTLEDILEEIVGEFTTDMATLHKEIYPQDDGSYIIDGSLNIRTINRELQLTLPERMAKTLSGLIIEYLEMIPEPGTCIKIEDYPIEVLQVSEQVVRSARIFPKLLPKNSD